MFRAALLSVALTSSALAATTPEAPTRDGGAPAQSRTKGAFEHDGFYLRLSTGFGGYNEGFQSRSTPRYGGESGGDARGFASVGELAIGHSVASGFVLGGGVYTASLLSSTFERDEGVTVPDELEPKRRNFALIGPFVDWYPNARKGFHLQGAVGFATLQEGWKGRDAASEPEYSAIGGGLMLGVGYDWFVAEEWSLGVLARVTGAVLTGTDDDDVRFFHAVGTSPSLLFSATYN